MIRKLERIFLLFLVFVPITFYFGFFTANPIVTFITSIFAIAALARVIGYATNEIVLQTNPTISGLVNATFGNMIELIIAILALQAGLVRVVQASIIGSIIGNILLLIGLSVLFGGLRYKEQKFNKTAVGISATMLIIAVAGLLVPTAYAITTGAAESSPDVQAVSNAVAIILAFTYIAGLVFSLFTHKDLFDSSDEIRAVKEKPTMGLRRALLIVLIATVFAAVTSEVLVSQVQAVSETIGLTQTFIGIVIIAIITNIAEKANAIYFSLKNHLDVALEIGLSSGIQISLFVVPILMLAGHLLNYSFSLVFPIFDIVAVIMAVMIINYLSADGKCNWLEGVQLLAIYLILIVAFYFVA
ncbi:MAG: calcium/proton exchanger [archaeon]|jgi:Ca2+:H+ antiporter